MQLAIVIVDGKFSAREQVCPERQWRKNKGIERSLFIFIFRNKATYDTYFEFRVEYYIP